MIALRDPEGVELSHLLAACPLSGKTILEIGCGYGHLTCQYAAWPGQIIGIDPKKSDLITARDAHPASLSKVAFVEAAGGALPFPSQKFEVALFASSL